MILVSDINVHPRVHVISNIYSIVPNYRTPPSNQAAVANDHNGVGHHLLVGHHSRGERDVSGDHGVLTDTDPSLSIHVPGGPTNYRTVTELFIRPSPMIIGAN